MFTKFCVSRETANNFIHLFVNRRAYGMQATQPLPNGSVPYYLARDWQTKQPKPLDVDVVRMHLNGDITINLYAINPETQRSKWVTTSRAEPPLRKNSARRTSPTRATWSRPFAPWR